MKFRPEKNLYCKPCRRFMRFTSYSTTSFSFWCGGCNKSDSRALTAHESRHVKKVIAKQIADIEQLHALSRKFHKRVWRDWKWMKVSYDLMQYASRFSIKNPEVTCINVDDAYHATSSLVLIPHGTPDQYMGTTVLYIPQCTGECPIKFFLYEEHIDQLIATLKRYKQRHVAARREARRLGTNQGD